MLKSDKNNPAASILQETANNQVRVSYLWQKMVLNSYSTSFYNPCLYPIFIEKLKEIKKLTIPTNQDNPYINHELFLSDLTT